MKTNKKNPFWPKISKNKILMNHNKSVSGKLTQKKKKVSK